MLLTRPGISETRPPGARTGRWLEISSSPPSLATARTSHLPARSSRRLQAPPLLRHRSSGNQTNLGKKLRFTRDRRFGFDHVNCVTMWRTENILLLTILKQGENLRRMRSLWELGDRQRQIELVIGFVDIEFVVVVVLLWTCFVVMQSDCTSVGRICQRVSVHKRSYLPLETCSILIPIKLTTKSSSSWATALFLFFFPCVKRHLSCMHCS